MENEYKVFEDEYFEIDGTKMIGQYVYSNGYRYRVHKSDPIKNLIYCYPDGEQIKKAKKTTKRTVG